MTYSEQDRKLIAAKEYDNKLKENDIVKINREDGTEENLGTVSKIIDDEVTGVQAMVIEEPDGNVNVLFQGSKPPGEEGWVEDWLETDIPMAT